MAFDIVDKMQLASTYFKILNHMESFTEVWCHFWILHVVFCIEMFWNKAEGVLRWTKNKEDTNIYQCSSDLTWKQHLFRSFDIVWPVTPKYSERNGSGKDKSSHIFTDTRCCVRWQKPWNNSGYLAFLVAFGRKGMLAPHKFRTWMSNQ